MDINNKKNIDGFARNNGASRGMDGFKNPLIVQPSTIQTRILNPEKVENVPEITHSFANNFSLKSSQITAETTDQFEKIEENHLFKTAEINEKSELKLDLKREMGKSKEKRKFELKIDLKSLIIIFLVIIILFGGVFVVIKNDNILGWNLFNKTSSGNNSASTSSKSGTFAAYEEGKINKKQIGGSESGSVYKNDLFPNFSVESKADVWAITENDRNKDNEIRFDLMMRNGDINIVYSFYGENNGLNSGSLCFKKDDLAEISPTWVREKRLNETFQSQIGYFYMPKSTYIPVSSPEFEARYKDYLEFLKIYPTAIIPKDQIAYCSTAQRISKTKTSKPQDVKKSPQNQVYLRIFTPSSNISPQELEKMDLLAKSINI